ncbi:MAG: lipocalin-like domain-containing protein [Trichloromonadaceae bacterium]
MPWLLLLFTLLFAGCSDPAPAPRDTRKLSLSDTLGAEESAGYARALAPRPFVFPADHGPHPEFKTEWWYYTGNLAAADGRRFGYQLTFFRIALTPQPIPRASAWGVNQLTMAHFAVTDAEGKRFVSAERFARNALGLAGAQAAPFRVWLEDWQASGPQQTFPMRLQAATDQVALDFTLEAGKPLVLQGERGLSRKSAEAGNASYYYSLTRLPTRGTLRLGDEEFQLVGHSWLDREWSTSALAPDQTGWDWFALQLDDGHELMYYQLRRQDGSADPASAGVWVRPDGSSQGLGQGDLTLESTKTWTSPRGGRYPAGWRLRVAQEDLDLAIEPLLADQELDVTIRYWEGAVKISGQRNGQPVSGYGYVELTGYAEEGGE